MKKRIKMISAVLLVWILTCGTEVLVWADVALDWYPQAEGVDYYVVVSAPDGGVNLRYGPGVEYDRLMERMIPNQVYLHVTDEAQASNGNYWGYTEYEGMYGWIALTQVSTVDGPPPAEATEIPKATPTATPTETITPTETKEPSPTATPSETITPTETKEPSPTATPEIKKGYTISYSLMAKLMGVTCVVLVVSLLALILLLKRRG